MDRLIDFVEGTLKIAEDVMQKQGAANPRVAIFCRDQNGELETFMVDLTPQSYFDDRLAIMKTVGEFLAKETEKIRSIDTICSYGEAMATIDGIDKPVLMASGLDSKGNSITKYKEIQKYILPDSPERQFFSLQDLELKGVKYEPIALITLLEHYQKNGKK